MTAAVSALLTLVFRHEPVTDQVVRVASVSPVAFLLPLAAGAAGALTLCQARRSSLVSGAGAGLLVAASLAPPAGVVGIGAALGLWELMGDAAFLLALQLVGIDAAGATVFRLFGVGPQGRRYPHGSRRTAGVAWVALAAALAGLLALQFGSAPPLLVRAGMESRARSAAADALRGDPAAWRSTRGVNCEAASCRATMVTEKTTPVTVISPPAMDSSTPRAPSAPPPKTQLRSTSPPNRPAAPPR